MTSFTVLCLHLVTIIAIFLNGLGSGLRLEISPPIVNELITDEVQINCYENDSPFWTLDAIFLEVGKKGQNPLAILSKAKIKYGDDFQKNMKAEGFIDEVNITQSYLRLSILKPGVQDSGVYYCKLFYMDPLGEIKEGKTYANLTVDNDNDRLVIIHLLKQSQEQQQYIKELEEKVTTMEITERNNSLTVQTLSDKVKTMEGTERTNSLTVQTLSDKVKTMEGTERNNSLKIQSLADKDSTVNARHAFMAGYDSRDGVEQNKLLIFRKVLLRIGDGFDEHTGTFTAPEKGLYVFNLYAWVLSAHGLSVQIKVNNNKVVGQMYVHYGYSRQTSISIPVSLDVGDKVNCVPDYVYTNQGLNNFPTTGFSGYLVKTL